MVDKIKSEVASKEIDGSENSGNFGDFDKDCLISFLIFEISDFIGTSSTLNLFESRVSMFLRSPFVSISRQYYFRSGFSIRKC